MKALLVVDMLNDFMTGKIANPRARGRCTRGVSRQNVQVWYYSGLPL